MIPENELTDRIRRVKAVIFDVDGTLTDGRIVLGNYGDELKCFDIHDGHGLTLLHRAGLKTAFLTARKSRITARRAKELKVTKVVQNAKDKLKAYEKLARSLRVANEEVCYVGDDLIDLPVMTRVGFAAAPASAVAEVKEKAHYVTTASGGRGAAREIADRILKVQGKWQDVTQRYTR